MLRVLYPTVMRTFQIAANLLNQAFFEGSSGTPSDLPYR